MTSLAVGQRSQPIIINDSLQEKLPINSRFGSCDGVTQTTALLARESLQSRIDRIIPRLGLTPCGKTIVSYVTCALETNRWNGYFNKSVLNFEIHDDYLSWYREKANQCEYLAPPVSMHEFMRTLDRLLPMRPPKEYDGRSQFSTAEQCKELWAAAQKAIEKEAFIPPGDSVEKYVISNKVAFKPIITFYELHTDYRLWCEENGYLPEKATSQFIKALRSSIPSTVFWRKKYVKFEKPCNGQKPPLPLPPALINQTPPQIPCSPDKMSPQNLAFLNMLHILDRLEGLEKKVGIKRKSF